MLLLSFVVVPIAAMALVPGPACGSWTGLRGGPSRNSSADNVLPAILGIDWKFAANGDLRAPLCIDGSAYVVSSNGRVYSVAVDNGSEEWSLNLGKVVFQPLEAFDDGVHVSVEDDVHVIPLAGGNVTRYVMPGEIAATPAPLGAYIILGIEAGIVIHDGGTVLYSESLPNVPSTIASNGGRAFLRYASTLLGVDPDGSNVSTTLPSTDGMPVIHDGRIYIISGDSLRVYDADLSLEASIPVADGAKGLAVGSLAVFTVGSNVTAYDPDTLVHRWTSDIDLEITTPPLVLGNAVAVGTETGVSIISSKGKHLQDIALDDRPLGGLAPCGSGILAATRGNSLYLLTSDADGDSIADRVDTFPSDPTQWSDADGDGHGDNTTGNGADAFPSDPTQWSDADGDGYGDDRNGTSPDAFPDEPTQHSDSDGDGFGDDPLGVDPDDYPSDPTQWRDTDGDGHGDNPNGTAPDAFPADPTQWKDTDGDGHGDNLLGNDPDMFPADPTQWRDADGDTYGDDPEGTKPDAFPHDPTQWNDTDGDDHGDNPMGLNADRFPTDPTQWNDTDGDGYGDNPDGTAPDRFPLDRTQWNDTDSDGYGDNPDGENADPFPEDPTQWSDADGDGHGDNPSGTSPDDLPGDPTQWNDADGDGYGDDPDGDRPDAFPMDPDEWADSDGDGVGDNGDERPYDADDDGTDDAEDAFPLDPAASVDDDRDGHPDAWHPGMGPMDSTTGLTIDRFPKVPSQWVDADGDGHGDNATGYSGDLFPADDDEWADGDEDGHGDNGDLFPDDPDEWADSDGDGVGDNADIYPNDRDNDGRTDGRDEFPDDPDEWSDADGDGKGDNSDAIPINDVYFFTGLLALVAAAAIVAIAATYRRRARRRQAARASRQRRPAGRARPSGRQGGRPAPRTSGKRPEIPSGTRRPRVSAASSRPPAAGTARGTRHVPGKAAAPRVKTVKARAGKPPARRAASPSAGIRNDDLEEVHRRYRGQLRTMMEAMREKGIPSDDIAVYSSRSRQGPARGRVDALMKGVAKAERKLVTFDTALAMSNEMKMAAADLRDRGYSTASLRIDALEAERMLREGDERSAYRVMVPVLPYVRRLRALPRGSERPADEVERLVATRRVLAGGDPSASRDLLANALVSRGAETRGDILVMRDPGPWGISFEYASRTVKPADVEAATVLLAVHNLKRIHLFSGSGFTPAAIERADELKVVKPMSVNEAMELLWPEAGSVAAIPRETPGTARGGQPPAPPIGTRPSTAAAPSRDAPSETPAGTVPPGTPRATPGRPPPPAQGPEGSPAQRGDAGEGGAPDARAPSERTGDDVADGTKAGRAPGRQGGPKRASGPQKRPVARRGSPPPRRKDGRR
ncbi:MAG: hypothetical protein L0Z54_03330 [Thermoplasmata archaeon]|nr:hypothetical protein [Thermoplasmata archaeon]